MKDWPFMRGETEAELERANDLLDKADALLRRHRGADPEPAPDTLPGNDTDVVVPLEDEDDLPILTDIVEDFEPAVPVLTEVAAPVPPPVATPAAPLPPPTVDRARIAEQLIEIDTEVSREVEAWLANELPQILSRELDALVEKVRSETLAHLRATLLPTLSDRIARRLDELDD